MFLTIVTRACQRPRFLSDNIRSVEAQTCQDVEQIFIVDRQRQGIRVADKSLALNSHRVEGDYVYILDDDCVLIDDRFVELVKGVAGRHGIVMVKSRRPPGPPSRQSIVPTPSVWGGKMRHGSTNCLCYVLRSDLWKAHARLFGSRPWGGDWWMLKSVLDTNPSIHWLDEIVADCRQLGRGKKFELTTTDWFEPVATRHKLENLGNDDWRLRLWMQS